MTSQNNRQFVIESGPGKFGLAASLFTGTGCRHPNVVEFSLQGIKNPLAVAVRGVEQEDGSGESWNFKGTTFYVLGLHIPVEGYYSTRSRKGIIRFVSQGARVWDGGKKAFVEIPDLNFEREIDETIQHMMR
jgi:hypothetical protein